MTKVIKIECQGAKTAPYKKLQNFQGDLKLLSEAAYEKFKANLIENGFSEPISVWVDDGEYKIINGHQRLATIKRMVENEHYEIDELPISIVEAKDFDSAKKKVLALTSEYGKVTEDGLLHFLKDTKIDYDYIQKITQINGVDYEAIKNNMGSVDYSAIDNEIDIDNYTIPDDVAIHNEQPPPTEKPDDPTSGLKLVQIFLTEAEVLEFKEMCDEIREKMHLENLTETILAAVRKLHETVQSK